MTETQNSLPSQDEIIEEMDYFMPPSPETELRVDAGIDCLLALASPRFYPFADGGDTGHGPGFTVGILHKVLPDKGRINADIYKPKPDFKTLADLEGEDILDMMKTVIQLPGISYTKRGDDSPEIYLSGSAQTVRREVLPENGIEQSLGNVSISIAGDQKFMDLARQQSLAHQEAQENGATKITEATMRLFAAKLEQAIAALSKPIEE